MLSTRVSPILSFDKEIVSRYYLCQENPYHCTENPQGYINFGTAENYLLWDLLKSKFNTAPAMVETDTHYQEIHGKKELRVLLADLLARRSNQNVSPDEIVVAAGATSILEILAFALCDIDDGVLVASPYYSGFDYAFQMRANAKIIPVPTYAKNNFTLVLDDLLQVLENAKRFQKNVKALLINSPSNPLGQIYSEPFLEEIVKLCDSEKISLVIDEIYAESYFPHILVASVLSAKYPNVHTVYGFAKDFALSGLAVGVLHSKNKDLIKVAQKLTHFCRVSSQTQSLLQYLLTDDQWLKNFFDEARVRLHRAYSLVTSFLDEAKIPYINAEGGIFLFIDLNQFMEASTFDNEEKLNKLIFDKCRINLSPGSVFHCAEPGWFRLCYAIDEVQMEEGLARLRQVLLSR